MSEYQIIPFDLPANCKVEFGEILTEYPDNWLNITHDLAYIDLPNDLFIDVEWNAHLNRYIVRVIRNSDWDKPVATLYSTTSQDAVADVNRLAYALAAAEKTPPVKDPPACDNSMNILGRYLVCMFGGTQLGLIFGHGIGAAIGAFFGAWIAYSMSVKDGYHRDFLRRR